jgi:transmembrane sensor
MDATDRQRRASAEAAEWFATLQSANLARDRRDQFVRWLLESRVHVAEFLRVIQVHGALEQFDGWPQISIERSAVDRTVVQLAPVSRSAERGKAATRERGKPTKSVTLGRLLSAAAAILLICAVAATLLQIRGQMIDTERGERRQVVLSDGSIVQVDPETQLRVRYSAQSRRVFLTRGRALFHVAKNKDRPFLVNADGTTVRAVGTAFGVERQSQRVVITVAEGKVSVTSDAKSLSPPLDTEIFEGRHDHPKDFSSGVATRAPPARPNTSSRSSIESQELGSDQANGALLLSANQQIILEHRGSAETVRTVDSDRELAWAEGRLIFQNDDVAEVATQFNRYNRVQLRVADEALARRRVSGVFNAAAPESFIAFLQTVAPVRIVRDKENSITIVSAAGH